MLLGLALAGVSWGDSLDGVEVVPLGGNCSVCGRWIPAGESRDCWLRSKSGPSNPSVPAPRSPPGNPTRVEVFEPRD